MYSGEDFDQATYSYQAYGQGALAPQNISSHPEYADGAFPSGYAAPDVYTGPSDPSLSYGYGGHHGRATAQAHLPSQRSTYPGQYVQGGNPVYGSATSGVAADFANAAWTSDTTYVNHRGTSYH